MTHPIYFLSGPQGIGKSRHAEQLAVAIGATTIVDDWNGYNDDKLPAGALVITSADFMVPPGAVEIHVEDAAGLDNFVSTLRPVRMIRRPAPTVAQASVVQKLLVGDYAVISLEDKLALGMDPWHISQATEAAFRRRCADVVAALAEGFRHQRVELVPSDELGAEQVTDQERQHLGGAL